MSNPVNTKEFGGEEYSARFKGCSSRGMSCPNCGNDGSAVIDARPAQGYFRRRRQCLKCRYRFTTEERILGQYIIDYQI